MQVGLFLIAGRYNYSKDHKQAPGKRNRYIERQTINVMYLEPPCNLNGSLSDIMKPAYYAFFSYPFSIDGSIEMTGDKNR